MMNNRLTNQTKRFIVIEGLDGSGKSTQFNLLHNYLAQQNQTFKYIHFPRTCSPEESPIFGEMVANFLKGDYGDANQVNPYLVALLFAGDRNNAKATIQEWLDNDYFIVLDRYVYSNIAFQGAKIKNPEEKKKLMDWILHLEYEFYKIPKPTISIFLHMNFDFIIQKLKSNREGSDRHYLEGKTDIHEKNIKLQAQVEKEYLHLTAENNDFHRIDCFTAAGETLSPNEIHSKIIQLLLDKKML